MQNRGSAQSDRTPEIAKDHSKLSVHRFCTGVPVSPQTRLRRLQNLLPVSSARIVVFSKIQNKAVISCYTTSEIPYREVADRKTASMRHAVAACLNSRRKQVLWIIKRGGSAYDVSLWLNASTRFVGWTGPLCTFQGDMLLG